MMKIRRYPLKGVDPFEMPAGARLMKLELYHGCANVWALVDDTQPDTLVRFQVFATDEYIPPGAVFINTLVLHEMEGGQLAEHWFMVPT